jgi:hypothetical protein
MIVKAVDGDRDTVCQLMVEAFVTRKSKWMDWSHESDDYEDRIRRAFRLSFDFSLSLGEVWVCMISDEIVGAFMWLDSRRPIIGPAATAMQCLIKDAQGTRSDAVSRISARLGAYHTTSDHMYLVSSSAADPRQHDPSLQAARAPIQLRAQSFRLSTKSQSP